MEKTRKTQRIEGVARVARVGHTYIGMMSWESPFVVFEVYESETSEKPMLDRLVWHSDNVDILFNKLAGMSMERGVDCWFNLDCFIRNDRVWRVNKLEYR